MKRGFTIIEFLVVVSIIVLISTILFVGRGQEEARFALQRSAFKLVQDLREVQEMAMSAEGKDCGGSETYDFGIYFHSSDLPYSYILFADCNGNNHKDSSDEILREVGLEKNTQIYILSPFPLDVVFSPPDPITFINGNQSGTEAEIVIGLKDNPGQAGNQRKVRINSAGRIEME